MDRRYFLRTLIGGVAATAAVRAFPFRVYSFPTEIATISLPERYADVMLALDADITESLTACWRASMLYTQGQVIWKGLDRHATPTIPTRP